MGVYIYMLKKIIFPQKIFFSHGFQMLLIVGVALIFFSIFKILLKDPLWADICGGGWPLITSSYNIFARISFLFPFHIYYPNPGMG